MKNSMFDMYLRDNVITTCETYFNSYLKKEGQLDVILDMITEIHLENEDEQEASNIVVDKLVSLCVVSKMNEARLCRLLNELQERIE